MQQIRLRDETDIKITVNTKLHKLEFITIIFFQIRAFLSFSFLYLKQDETMSNSNKKNHDTNMEKKKMGVPSNKNKNGIINDDDETDYNYQSDKYDDVDDFSASNNAVGGGGSKMIKKDYGANKNQGGGSNGNSIYSSKHIRMRENRKSTGSLSPVRKER